MKPSPFLTLCGAGLFAIFSSTISKSPVLPLFAAHLSGDPAVVGLIASVSALTGILTSFPAGILSDQVGRKKMLLVSAFVFATAPFLYLFVDGVWGLAAVRFYHGFATAIFLPIAMAMVSDLFQKERGEKMGWFSTSTLLGRFIAPTVGGTILALFVMNPVSGFRAVYLVCGAAGLITFLAVFLLPDTNLISHKGEKKWGDAITGLKAVVSNRNIILTCVVEASILFAYGIFETFMPLFAKGLGLTSAQIGICLSIQVITLALTKPAMGRFSDIHGRRPQIFAGALLGAICVSLFSISGTLPGFFFILLALSILLGLCFSIVTSATSAYIADLSHIKTYGSAMGILGSLMDIGHTAGPIVGGILAASLGLEKAFIGAGIVLFICAFFFLAGQK